MSANTKKVRENQEYLLIHTDFSLLVSYQILPECQIFLTYKGLSEESPCTPYTCYLQVVYSPFVSSSLEQQGHTEKNTSP